MIQRIFHPVGQGAFYSERHGSFNIVYDCGNWRNTKLSDKVVKQSFDKNEVIDILFISHFDFDHVSKISTLKKHVKGIKKVILPLLHDNEKILLTSIYRVLNFNILTLINNPQRYFGEKTKIIFVEPPENDESLINDDIEPINIDKIPKNIQSGTKITQRNLIDWIFIPFNNVYNQRSRNLKSLFISNKIDIEKFRTDLNYALNKRPQIKKIYNKLNGKINQNSMLLYSGPLQVKKYHRHCFIGDWPRHFHYYFDCHCYYNDKVACVYTGDADLNITNIKTIFRSYWNNVGTIQVPHHGDINTFNSQVVKDKNYCCPISVGVNNSYGHPSSKVIVEILSKHSCPILVTEKLDSMFIEIIE